MSEQNIRKLNLVIEELQTNYQKYFDFVEKPQLILTAHFERPHSFIWKYRIDGNSTRKSIYIKIHKRTRTCEDCKVEYEILKSLYAAFDQYPLYSVVKPVAYFSEYSIIITEDAEGEELSDQIKHRARQVFPDQTKFMELAKYCYSTGEWLRIYQSVTKITQLTTLRECGLMESVLEALKHWDELGINSGIQFHIIHHFEQAISKLGCEMIEMGGQHGDFVPFNVIVSHDRIILCDFPCCRNGAIYHDVARFYSALLTFPKNPLYNSKKIEQLLNLFIEGYRKGIDFSYEIFNLFVIYHMVTSLHLEESLSGKTLFQKCYRRRVISFYFTMVQGKM